MWWDWDRHSSGQDQTDLLMIVVFWKLNRWVSQSVSQSVSPCVISFIQIFFWGPIEILSSLYLSTNVLLFMIHPRTEPGPGVCFVFVPRVWGGTQVKLSAPAPSLHKLAWLHCRSHCLSSSRQSIQIARWSRSRGSRPVNTVRDNRNMQEKIIQRREVERGATWLCVVYLLSCTWLVQFVV